MCLVLLAWKCHPGHALVLAANRDEFYVRPTEPARFWTDGAGEILGGRDLQAGGTWLAVTRSGRYAAVTNVRDLAAIRPDGPSRGHLVRDFLLGGASPSEYAGRVSADPRPRSGFNLLLGDADELVFVSNVGPDPGPRRLVPGIHGLSNASLDTPWPKVVSGRQGLAAVLGSSDPVEAGALLDLLADRRQAEDHALPDTGVGPEVERMLSPLFIESETYGTRSSTVVMLANDGSLRFVERTHGASSEAPDAVFELSIDGAH